MKKVAVLLFGDYREFETASSCYEVFKEFDVDYFVSTWDKTTVYNEYYDTKVEDVTERRVNKFLPTNAVFISTLDENQFSKLNYTQKMVKHWKVLGDALKERKEEYDIVCLLRIEFYIQHFDYRVFINEGSDKKLHIDFKGLEVIEGLYSVGDRYHVGSPELILSYIDMLPLEAQLTSHIDFGSILKWSSIPIAKEASISGLLLRPTTAKILSRNHKNNIETLNRNFANIYTLYELFTYWHHDYANPLSFKEYINNIIHEQRK